MSITAHPKKILADLSAFEFPIVAFAVLISAINSAWLAGAVIVSAAFWPIRRVVTGRWTRRTPVDWPVVLLLLMLPVTVWASVMPEKTLPQVLRLLAGAALFYSIANWAHSSVRLRQATNLLLAAGLLLALAAPFVVQWNVLKLAFIPSSWYSGFRLLVADPANPNVMAGSLVLFLLPAISLLLFAWQDLCRRERLLAGGLILAGGAALVLTQSRGAWFALLAGLALLALLRWRYGWLVVLAGIIGGALAVTSLGLEKLAGALFSSPSLGGVEGRLEIWSRAIYMLQDFPFTGVGMGSFTEVADRLYPFFLYAPGSVEHAHNLFLQVAVDLGLPGLVAWLAILLGTSWCAWQVYRRASKTQQSWPAGLAVGLLAAQLALVMHGLSDAVVWGMVRPAPLVWLLWGMSAAAVNHDQVL